MPFFRIETNVSRNNIPEKFLEGATDLIATQLGKPASYVCIQVCPDQIMSFGGTEEPCANVTLCSIGAVGPDINRKLAPVLSSFIEQQLGIKQDRFYIIINDIPRSSCIWNGKTFG